MVENQPTTKKENERGFSGSEQGRGQMGKTGQGPMNPQKGNIGQGSYGSGAVKPTTTSQYGLKPNIKPEDKDIGRSGDKSRSGVTESESEVEPEHKGLEEE